MGNCETTEFLESKFNNLTGLLLKNIASLEVKDNCERMDLFPTSNNYDFNVHTELC